MALVSKGRSTLNPNAPLFVPAAYRQVEDFSPEWWQLITTSPWYHDYWLSQNQDEERFYSNADNEVNDVAHLLPETFDLDAGEDFSNMEAQFEEFIRFSELEADKSNTMNEIGSGSGALIKNMKYLEERSPKFPAQAARYAEKPAKNLSPKYSPRLIQQPR
ncbi:hypothetical protein UlMin_006140 [Ulmus minor]